jgi:2-oxoglutarate dehydrogenase E2 component (dihydrolipoamide succinyltransferase)
MSIEMVMPQMGESIAEATISKWLVKVGDKVEKDQPILEISTDKVDSEIPSPATGVVTEIKYQEGAVVPVKVVIAVIDPSGEVKATAPSTNGKATNGKAELKAEETDLKVLTPLVKELASQHGVSLSELEKVQGSGQGGRVTKDDFMNYLKERDSKSAKPAPTVQQTSQPTAQVKPIVFDDSEATIIPMDNMRAAIADHMVRSKQTSPHVYSIQEVDVSRIAAWRAKNKKEFSDKEGFSLSFTPFFLEAAVKGLQKFPLINSSVDGRRIIQKKHINLGCAVALGNSGLIVPVIKRAEEKNLVGLARALNDLALRARNKKLSPDDVAGGTFTVTNPGVFGTLIGTPIINQPQVAILCLGAITKRPVVINDMIAIREMCFLTLSYDHRIIDGSLGGQYLAFIREYLENWDMERSLY